MMKVQILKALILLQLLNPIFGLRNILSSHKNKDSSLENEKRILEDKPSCILSGNLQILEKIESDEIIYHTTEGEVSPGDITVWRNGLYDKYYINKKIGETSGFCYILQESVYQCTITYKVEDGTMTLAGAFVSNPESFSIVGGTGCYKDIEGGRSKIWAQYLGDNLKTLHYFDIE